MNIFIGQNGNSIEELVSKLILNPQNVIKHEKTILKDRVCFSLISKGFYTYRASSVY